MIKEFGMDALKKALRNGKVIVDFWAPWCGPCKAFTPTFEKVSKDHKGISFAKLNVEDFPEVASEFGISSIPCIIFFNKGDEVGRLIGMQDEDGFEEKIADVY